MFAESMIMCLHWCCDLMHAVLMHNGMVHLASMRDALVHRPANALHALVVHRNIDVYNMCRIINACCADANVRWCCDLMQAVSVHNVMVYRPSMLGALVHQHVNALHVL